MRNLSEAPVGIAQCAISILHAWHKQDLQLLSTGIEQALDAPPPAASPRECERRELLQEIAREIRRAHRPLGPGCDPERIGVCIGLLEHLVATD